ncbi:MAG TPA: PIN domain-containing protein [Gemmataceae bacterium]|jgi:tRNA(fMet)-specific endonuclease VapC|nr:PIN domain-containing protein [Gemmataceae bacterium]
MPTYLFDTNAVSDLVRDHPKIKSKLSSQSGSIITSVINRGELRYGLERLPADKKKSDLERRVNSILKVLFTEAVTDQVAEEYGRLKRSLELQGISVQDNDLWIASTARKLGATLVSRDQVFLQIPGLQVEDWTK